MSSKDVSMLDLADSPMDVSDSEVSVSVASVGQAARCGELDILKELVDGGHPVDAPDNRGWLPIHEAAHGGFYECLHFLLDTSDSKVNWSSHEGKTSLHLACRSNHADCAQLLIDHGANLNSRDFMQCTPLHSAVFTTNLDLCRMLLDSGADVNCQQYCGTSPLHHASADGLHDVACLLLEHGAKLDILEDFDITPIFSAAQFNQHQVLDLLIECAQERSELHLVNKQTQDGATPLFIASQEGNIQCVSKLLHHGADVNLCTSEPQASPLLAALQFNHSEVVKLLLPETSTECINKCSITPFYFATLHSDSACTELLAQSGFDVNERRTLPENESYEPKVLRYFMHQVRYSRRLTPLSMMTLYENALCHAEVLIKAGASLNPQTPYEVPPLLPALDKYQLNLASYYIAHGAYVNLYHPKVMGNMTIVACLHYWKGLNLLLSCGAEVSSLFKRTVTAAPYRFRPCHEILDAMGDADYEDDYENEPGVFSGPVPFWRLLSEARYVMSRKGVTPVQVLMRLMHFVTNVSLDVRLKSLVDSDEQWAAISSTQASPRLLTHLCRLRIRGCLGAQRLLHRDPVHELPLPWPLLDFILFKEIFDEGDY